MGRTLIADGGKLPWQVNGRKLFRPLAGLRYSSPRAMTAQTMRVVLLAMATVARRTGFFSSNRRIQIAVGPSACAMRRTTEVAPFTSSVRR